MTVPRAPRASDRRNEPLTLPEELLLLAIVPGSGRVADRSNVVLGVAGSMLHTLARHGVVRPDGKRFDVVGGRSPMLGDGVLDDAVGALGAGERPRTGAWLRRTARRRPEHAYLARLAERGVLRTRRSRALGIFPVTRYQVTDKALLRELRGRLDTAARGKAVPEADRTLGALVAAVRLERRLYRGRENRDRRKALRALVPDQWPAAEVLREVRSREAAAASAAGAG